jgi:hypothetical protein
MYRFISKEGIGLVGATGSYQSPYTDVLNYLRERKSIPFYKKMFMVTYSKWMKLLFDPFPNYHIRTNAFMISSEDIRRIRCRFIKMKFDAWRFESGKAALTKQIMRMNKRVLVVGKDGKGYEKEDWYRSNTFWQANQDNLLVADNQTNKYLNGDVGTQRQLNRFAWGDKVYNITELCSNTRHKSDS